MALERAASARTYSFSGMPDIVRKLPFVRCFITMNGAMVYDAQKDRILYAANLGCARADQVYDGLDTLDVIYDCFQDGWGWMR